MLRNQPTSTPAASVDALQSGQQKLPHTKRQFSGKRPWRQRQASNHGTESIKEKVCGKSPIHKIQQCPAKDSTCHKCGKKGHYQTICRSRTIGDVTTEDDLFLGAVHEDRSEPMDCNYPHQW